MSFLKTKHCINCKEHLKVNCDLVLKWKTTKILHVKLTKMWETKHILCKHQQVKCWNMSGESFMLYILQQRLPSGHMTLIQRRLNVDATSWRCIDVEPTLYKRHVPAGLPQVLLIFSNWSMDQNITLYGCLYNLPIFHNVLKSRIRGGILLLHVSCPFDITRKDVSFFCLAFYFKWKYFILVDHILSETICLFCFCVLFSDIYSKIKFTAINWSDLCTFYSTVIFWNFCLRKYFLIFFAKFELLMFYNNTVKISEKKKEQAELVENLTASYLPYRFFS